MEQPTTVNAAAMSKERMRERYRATSAARSGWSGNVVRAPAAQKTMRRTRGASFAAASRR
jgi:hypothetical protein